MMRVNGYDYDWSEVRKRLSAIKESFPRAMAVVAQNFFVDSFRRQGWYEARSLKRWKARKKPDKSYKRRAILIKSGRLRRSIRIREATFVNITIAAEAPYAAAHNNGINSPQHVRAHTRHRPQSPARFSRSLRDSRQLRQTVQSPTSQSIIYCLPAVSF